MANGNAMAMAIPVVMATTITIPMATALVMYFDMAPIPISMQTAVQWQNSYRGSWQLSNKAPFRGGDRVFKTDEKQMLIQDARPQRRSELY
jgi:hypothetical protein